MPIEVAAGGFFAAITSFWDARLDEPPYRIIICLGEENFRPFFDAFRQASMMPGEEAHRQTFVTEPDEAVETGVISLDEDEVQSLEGDDVSDWFK